VIEAVMDAVGDGPVVIQGGVDLTDRLQNVLDPLNVQKGLLLAGERRVRQILGGRRRANRE
jgi:hypothetical protein